MTPEQLPWDRRDFRNQNRSGPDARFFGGGGGGFSGAGQHRWREQNRHPHALSPYPQPYRHHHNQTMKQRWFSDFRSTRPVPLPSGRGNQGGWHMVPEDAGHEFPPFGPRYVDRNLQDENFRPFRSHSDGRYLRNSRENKGTFTQKDWWSPSGEPHVASFSSPRISGTEINYPKSIENPLTCIINRTKGYNSEDTQTCHNSDKGNNTQDTQACLKSAKGNDFQDIQACLNSAKGNNSEDIQACLIKNNKRKNSEYTQTFLNNIKGNSSDHPLPDSLSGQSQSVMKEKNGNDGGTCDELASSHQKPDKEKVTGMTEWKLKWNRSLSMSSRGSSSSKSMGVDSIAKMVEVQHQAPMPMNSSAAVCVEPNSTTPSPSNDISSRKKPRLGWGEGLAKYEKKKVDGPEDAVSKDGLISSVSTTESMMQSPSVNLLDKGLKVANVLDCDSPAAPSLVACNSSPGTDEKESIKAVNIDHFVTNITSSPNNMSWTHCQEPTFNLENLDLASISNLSSSINEMVRANDPSSVNSGYVRTTTMNKLLLWKVDALKALEVTETETDSLDTELKSLMPEPRSHCPPATLSLIPGDCHARPCEKIIAFSTVRPDPLQVVASGDMIVENMPAVNEDEHETLKDETPECVGGINHSSRSGCSEDDMGDEEKTCLVDTIMASNKESANRAQEELNKLLPAQQCYFEMLDADNASSVQRDSLVIKERFLIRKRSLMFKEKFIALKFKVLQHFWKQGRIISVSQLRGKSRKKLDLIRTWYKKNCSPSHSRISYPARNSRKVPAEEVIEYVSALLADSPFKLCRSTLKMPSLILDKDSKMSRFISNNALVEDPCAAEKGRSVLNSWTAEEKEIFIDKLSIYGKEFSKLASFLERKTVADCVEFYYKNNKSECFQRAKSGKTKQMKPQYNNYMVANGKRWSREANAASLDILGEASAVVANVNEGIETEKKCAPTIFSDSQKESRNNHGPLERSNSLDNEAVAGVCGSISSEAMSSCITSSIDPVDGFQQNLKCQRVDDECSDERCEEMDSTDFTDKDKSLFVQALSSYGKDFSMISQCLRTKSVKQCEVFYGKTRKCLGLDRVLTGACNGGVSGGVNGSGSGSDITDDACVVQTGEECKIEVDHCPPESDIARMRDLKPDLMICVDINSQPCSLGSIAAVPVSKNSSVEDDKQAVVFSVDSRCQSGDANVETLVVPTNVEYLGVEDGDDLGQQSKVLSNDDDNERRGLITLTENKLEKKKVLDSEEVSAVGCMDIDMKDQPSASGNVPRPRVSLHLKKESVSEKHSLPHKVCDFASVESSRLFSVPINVSGNGMSQDSEKVCMGYPLLDSVDPSQILKGYPVLVQTVETNGDFDCVKDIPPQSLPKQDWKLNSDLSLRKCTAGLGNGIENGIFTPQESNGDHSRPDDVDKLPSSRKGDVKLFGKILISSQETSSRVCDDNNGNQLHHKMGNRQSLNQKPSDDQKISLDSFQSKVNFSNCISSDNNNTGWDENRTSSFPKPDSTHLVAKYPTSFSNCHLTPTMGKLDWPPLNSRIIRRSNDHKPPQFSLADYQFRNREIQPRDMSFFEMQRRNGFSLIPGMQSMVGILASGGQCSGVSDPVMAIKMHYANMQNERVKDNGNVIVEGDILDQRCSNGDLGR